MQQKKRIAFYFIWHLSSGMIIAFGLGLALIYPVCEYYGMGLRCIGQGEIVFLMLTGCGLAFLSFIIHRMIRGWQAAISDWETSWRILLIFGGVLVVLVMAYMLFILIPLLVECFLLLALDRYWDKQQTEKPKRKLKDDWVD